jgi:hypothetical protein
MEEVTEAYKSEREYEELIKTKWNERKKEFEEEAK